MADGLPVSPLVLLQYLSLNYCLQLATFGSLLSQASSESPYLFPSLSPHPTATHHNLEAQLYCNIYQSKYQ